MNKIFVAHSDDLGGKEIIRLLINVLGGRAFLVENEPGGDSPKEKSYRVMRDCNAFFAICTKDVKDSKDNYFPKPNVLLEIDHWLDNFDASKMVIVRENGCQWPTLLGNPTYAYEFHRDDLIRAVLYAISQLTKMGVIPTQSDFNELRSKKPQHPPVRTE